MFFWVLVKARDNFCGKWTKIVHSCGKFRKPCIFNISSTSDPIFEHPWEWSFPTCSYLVSISKHSHQIEAIWIALFLFENSLESSTKPRFFQLWSKPVIISKKWTKSVVCTYIQPCFGVLIVCPLHESKSNGEGIHPSTWRTWICSLTFAEGRSNRSKTHLIASIWKEIHIFHKRRQCWCFRRFPHHLPWPVAWFTRTSLRVHCAGAM